MSSTTTVLKPMEDRAIYNMHDAKSNLSRLVEQAAAGREIIIARDGKPAARLVALDSGRRSVRLPVPVMRLMSISPPLLLKSP